MNTSILVHGCHLQAKGWHDIVWGNLSENRLGRVPKAILEALKFKATTVIFSTGASEKDGLKEGEYVLRYAMEHLREMEGLTGMPADELAEWLQSVAVLELRSSDTRTEVAESGRIAKSRGAERLVLVSSPTHIERCHQQALSVFGSEPDLKPFLQNLYAVASDTPFDDSTVDDVVIVEPPHRGDRPLWQTHKYVAAFFRIMKDGDHAYTKFLEDLGRLLASHGVRVDWEPRKPTQVD